MHQAVAIMYCTQQVIQGKTFHDQLKKCKVFPLESFAVYGIIYPDNDMILHVVITRMSHVRQCHMHLIRTTHPLTRATNPLTRATHPHTCVKHTNTHIHTTHVKIS